MARGNDRVLSVRARRLVRAVTAVGVVLCALTLAPAALASSVSLVLPQGDAFAVLGYDCGGIRESAYATQFDPSTGYPDGDVYLSTTCSTGGRGGGSHTYTAWASAMWDFTGATVTYAGLSSAPTVDPTLSAFDANGNEIYNQNNQAYLALAPGFIPTPRVTGLSVTMGPYSGGTSVTISGTGFTGTTAVDFGSVAATSFTINSDTSITAASPPESQSTVDVTVTNGGGTSATSTSDEFTLVGQPSVSGVNPAVGPASGGGWVTVTGSDLTYATSVSFGDTPTSFVVNSDTSLSAYVIPAETAPDTVDITVTTLGGTSPITSADQYTYMNPPVVSAVSPASGSVGGGTTVTVTGQNFMSGATVMFGSTPSSGVKFLSNAKLTAVSPPGSAGSVDVTVTTSGGTTPATAKDLFAYGPPTIGSFTPAAGITGSTVTLTGTGDAAGLSVYFGALKAKATIVSGTTLKAVVPNGATPGAITVSDAQGSATSTTSFTPTLSITSFTPTSGAPGTVVTITGAGFLNGSVVKFNGVPAASTAYVSPSELQATVPTTATSGLISVTNSSAPKGTVKSASSFTVG